MKEKTKNKKKQQQKTIEMYKKKQFKLNEFIFSFFRKKINYSKNNRLIILILIIFKVLFPYSYDW